MGFIYVLHALCQLNEKEKCQQHLSPMNYYSLATIENASKYSIENCAMFSQVFPNKILLGLRGDLVQVWGGFQEGLGRKSWKILGRVPKGLGKAY